MRLTERLVLQLVEGDPPHSHDRLVLMDDHDGTEVVFDLATAGRLAVGLAYFLGRTGHPLPTEADLYPLADELVAAGNAHRRGYRTRDDGTRVLTCTCGWAMVSGDPPTDDNEHAAHVAGYGVT